MPKMRSAILRFDADPVVPDGKQPPVRVSLRRDMNSGALSLPRYLIELEMRFWKSCISMTSSATTVGNGSEVTVAPLSAMAACRFNSTLARTAPQSIGAKLSLAALGDLPISQQGLQQSLDPQGALPRNRR